MKLINGKRHLIQTIYSLITRQQIKKILLNGILDTEVIRVITDEVSTREKPSDIRFLVPNLRGQKLSNLQKSNLLVGKLRASIKCKAKFILLDDHVIFFSGSESDKTHHLGERDMAVLCENNMEISKTLLDSFENNWDNGVILHM
ncbi:hypothetical protein SAMN02745975_03113 [Geosporobacter subterraneus DSM 17957]|uniref:PLD-like domain-containing protein n=1 Tax=Geosporobacter subterraneus DSM 17957 TaxID=1121919 RepID=A0A1M6MW76_9FIRM|nr:hypothetical protein [Geosporobacter subterraneus]SHJ87735.1 hypothetical protein SAMN02745975_03113 [Geosporobacter subterraneus DSM 17957]